MTEESTPYQAGNPKLTRIVVTLTVDLDDNQIAAYLAGQIAANPVTGQQGDAPLHLDLATLGFLLDAVGPEFPEHYYKEKDYEDNEFADFYYEREWLRGYTLSVARHEAGQAISR